MGRVVFLGKRHVLQESNGPGKAHPGLFPVMGMNRERVGKDLGGLLSAPTGLLELLAG